MNETERRITAHLEHLAADAPDVDLVSAARSGTPARRSWTTPALVAAAVVVLVAVGALVVPRGGGGGDEPVVAGRASPTAPPGQRLVGRGGLVVSVPAAWPVVRHSCGTLPAGDRVVVSGEAVRDCGRSPVTDGVDVEITSATYPDPVGGTVRDVGGEPVRTVESPAPDGASGIHVVLASEESDTVFVLTGPADRVRAVAATLRPVPDGYAVVPDTAWGGTSDDDTYTTYVDAIRARFETAGFVVDLRRQDTDGLPRGGRSDRQAGTLARIGTTITLTFD